MTPRCPPFKVIKVIGIDTDRSAACDFLLVTHSNHWPYRFRDQRRKLQILTIHRVFIALTKGVPIGICNSAGTQKNYNDATTRM